jgi:uncharacterized protein YukE
MTAITEIYRYTRMLKHQAGYMKKYAKRVARLKRRIHQTHDLHKKRKLSNDYVEERERLRKHMRSYLHHLQHARTQISKLEKEF